MSYYAFNAEYEVYNYLGSIGRHVRWATVEEEKKFAIDIVVDNFFAVQVKPESYRKARNMSHAETQESNMEKNIEWIGPVFYVYYSGDRIDYKRLLKDITAYETPQEIPKKLKPIGLIDFM